MFFQQILSRAEVLLESIGITFVFGLPVWHVRQIRVLRFNWFKRPCYATDKPDITCTMTTMTTSTSTSRSDRMDCNMHGNMTSCSDKSKDSKGEPQLTKDSAQPYVTIAISRYDYINIEGFSLKTFFRLVQKRLPTVSVGFVSSVRFGTPFVLCVSSFTDVHSSLVSALFGSRPTSKKRALGSSRLRIRRLCTVGSQSSVP